MSTVKPVTNHWPWVIIEMAIVDRWSLYAGVVVLGSLLSSEKV